MTVASAAAKAGPYTGNDVATTFVFAFKVFADDDIRVIEAVIATAEETDLVLNGANGYTVTRNNDQDNNPGGFITYKQSNVTAALPSTKTLTIVGAFDYEQPTDIPNGGSFFAQVIENAFDRVTMLIKQLKEILDRSLTLPASISGVSTQLPVPEANKFIGWNEDATELQNMDTQTVATIVAYGSVQAELFSGDGAETEFTLAYNPAAIANLDVSVGGVTQRPDVDYFWTSGYTLTFDVAPPVGTENILVRYARALPQGAEVLAIKPFTTVAEAKAATGLVSGNTIWIGERAGSHWRLSSSGSANDMDVLFLPGSGVYATLYVVGVVNVKALGAPGDGTTPTNGMLLAARDIIATAGGGVVYFPAGIYLFDINTDMQDSFAEGMVIKGDGASTVIKFSGGQSIRALSLESVGISDVHLDSQNGYISFELCDNVKIERVSGQGLRTSGGDLSQRGVEIRGCVYTEVLDCDFDNYNYAVFFLKSGTTSCGTARIRGGLYQHTDPTSGTGVANPCGIYAWQIEYVFVEGVTFKNIKPSDAAGSPFYGFGVYEGDGTDGELELVSVKDCIFIRDTAAARGSLMVGVLTSLANVSVVDNCEFIGEFTGYRYGTRDLTISNCKFKGASLFTGPTAGVPGSGNTYTRFVIRNNEFSDITTNIPIILQNGSPVVQNVIVEGNTFRNSLYGAMWVRFVTHATILNNTIIDCNTSGNSNDFYRGGINFSGCTSGFVHGNTVINLTSGNAQYGVVSAASSHQITVTESNKFIGMNLGRFLRGYTSAPTFGTYEKGDRIKNWEVAAAGIPGYICTTAGTMGTLNGGATTGSITSGLSALTVNTTDFMVIGQYINVAGVTGPFRIENISGLVVTLSGNADATVSGAAVSFSNGVFKAEAAIAA